MGHFVDSTDGNTEETALTIANTNIKIWKMGATTLANKNSGGATHISNGIYYAVLDATDTDTLGTLVIFIHVAGALPVRVECEVLAANVYDSLVAATDKLEADTMQFGGNAINDYSAELLLKHIGVHQTDASVPAIELSSTAGAGMQIIGGDGEGLGVFGGGSADGLVIDAGVGGNASIAASSGVSLNGVQIVQAIWDAFVIDLVTVGSIGKLLADDIDAAISSRSSHSAADVWAAGTRTLTSFDNSKIEKNTALNNFMFFMRQSVDHVSPATGLTVTATRSLDGAAFSACSNAAVELGSGWYKINLAPSDMNGDVIALKFTATGADQRNLTVITQA